MDYGKDVMFSLNDEAGFAIFRYHNISLLVKGKFCVNDQKIIHRKSFSQRWHPQRKYHEETPNFIPVVIPPLSDKSL